MLSDGQMSYLLAIFISLHFLWLVERLLVICISSSMVYLFRLFPFFLLSIGFLIYRTSLYTVDINPLLDTYIANSFSQSFSFVYGGNFLSIILLKISLEVEARLYIWKAFRAEVSWMYRDTTNATKQNVCSQEYSFITVLIRTHIA